MTAYAAAKARVFGRRAIVVVNRDDPAAMKLVPPPAQVPTQEGRGRRASCRGGSIEFGAGAPERPGDWGLADQQRHGLAGARPATTTPRRASSPCNS